MTTDGSNSKQQRSTTSRFNVGEQRVNVRCYNCGSPSHLIRQCPYFVRSRATEILGTKMTKQSTLNKGCVSNVRCQSSDHEQLTESEKEGGHGESDAVDIGEDIINKVLVTMHGVTSSDISGNLSPALTLIVEAKTGMHSMWHKKYAI